MGSSTAVARPDSAASLLAALKPREQNFLEHYVAGATAAEAARRAGYAPQAADKQGWAVLQRPHVKAALAAMTAERAQSSELSARSVLEAIRIQVEADVRALYDAQGNLRPIHELSREEAMMIAGVEVVQRNLTSGDGATDKVIKVRLADRARYVELAAKHLGLLVERIRVEDGDAIEGRLRAARARVAVQAGDVAVAVETS